MFGRKRKILRALPTAPEAPPPKRGKGRAKTAMEDPPVATAPFELVDMPDDPVAQLQAYWDAKGEYENAIAVASQIGAIMNQLADALAVDGITVPHVGPAAADPRAARVEQARRMAAQMSGNGHAPAVAPPKAHAVQPSPLGGTALVSQDMQNRFPTWNEREQADPNQPPSPPAGVDPNAWAEEWRQANTVTPREVLAGAGGYVPMQTKLPGKSSPDNPGLVDPRVLEVRTGAEAGADLGFQQRAIERFSQLSAAAVAAAPTITQPR